jgi:hypothetical protein
LTPTLRTMRGHGAPHLGAWDDLGAPGL